LQHGWVNDPPINNNTDLLAGARKTTTTEITLDGGGDAAAQELVPARVGYFGVLEIHHVRTNFTDPSVDFDFIAAGGGTLLGGGPYDLAFTVDKTNEDIHETVMYIAAQTADTALQVNVTNGSAAGQVDIHYNYHYEVA
jgi:hypothetical protein